MTGGREWRERQYWSDVIAVRPDEVIARRVAASARARERTDARLDLEYGLLQRQALDLFLPAGNGRSPLLVFIHGGYWMRGLKDEWAFLAPGWTDRGIAVATLGYRLAPAAKLTDIISDIRSALAYLEREFDGRELDTSNVILSGISAGAHLAAMEATATHGIKPVGVALLSGVFDPRPLELTTPGAALCDSLVADLEDISPLGRPPPDCPAIIAWGADETDVFKNQSKMLARYWGNWGVQTELAEIGGANHFTISDCLQADRDSSVVDFILRRLMS